jgi:hypothetical protein
MDISNTFSLETLGKRLLREARLVAPWCFSHIHNERYLVGFQNFYVTIEADAFVA